ncbi:hypothetical protein E4T39_03593 [Aureobasidium subglaciale]|nr:hypothetical protein E4T39_03593 [Aureobasidium subglaciale]
MAAMWDAVGRFIFDFIVHVLFTRWYAYRSQAIVAAEGNAANALSQAAVDGDEGRVRQLLEQGTSVEESLDDRQTPLQFAAQEGHTRIVQLLIEHGADVNALRCNGSALGLAAEKGNEEVVKLLLSRRALVDGNEGPSWLTPLQASCAKGHIRVAKALLDAGADVNALDEPRLSPSPLRYACQIEREDIARLLLEGGANIDDRDTDPTCGLTPLQFCAAMGFKALVHTLVEFGADLDAPHRLGCPLVRAVTRINDATETNIEVVVFLLDKGANIEGALGGETPLQAASVSNRIAIARLLLDRGAFVDARNELYLCPLYNAFVEGHEETVELLLERDASVDVAIEDALRVDNLAVADALKQLGASRLKGQIGSRMVS